MFCIALFFLNLLQPVFVELLGLVFDHQSLYVSLICLKVVLRALLNQLVASDVLSTGFDQVSKFVAKKTHQFFVLPLFLSFNTWNSTSNKFALCFLIQKGLCFLCNNNNLLDYGLLVTKPTFLTNTSILTENPFKEKEEDVEETRGRKLSPFMKTLIDVFTGKGSSEETLKLVTGFQLLLLINVLSFAFFLPINGEYLDHKFSRFYVLWLQKWIETYCLRKSKHKDEKEKNSFLFKDSTLSWKREEVFLVMLLWALLLCFALLYLICLVLNKTK
jgi:hypothetical protein